MQRLSRIPKPRISRFNKISAARFATLPTASKIRQQKITGSALKFNPLIFNKYSYPISEFSTHTDSCEDIYKKYAINFINSINEISHGQNSEIEKWLLNPINDFKQYKSGEMDPEYLSSVIRGFDLTTAILFFQDGYHNDVESRFVIDFIKATNELMLKRKLENDSDQRVILLEEAANLAKAILIELKNI